VRVLLDENLPRDLVSVLAEHEVVTVQGLGWSGLKNGDLLRRAAGHIDAFITMDSNLQFQQRVEGLPFGVVIIHARSNRMADLLPIIDSMLVAITELIPGTVRHVGA
jgi:predicted nuclease of predicted toxin-antitoxin system